MSDRAGLELKYFVIKPRSKSLNDPYAMASRKALRAYAEVIKRENPQLAQDLFAWVERERLRCLEYGAPEDE